MEPCGIVGRLVVGEGRWWFLFLSLSCAQNAHHDKGKKGGTRPSGGGGGLTRKTVRVRPHSLVHRAPPHSPTLSKGKKKKTVRCVCVERHALFHLSTVVKKGKGKRHKAGKKNQGKNRRKKTAAGAARPFWGGGGVFGGGGGGRLLVPPPPANKNSRTRWGGGGGGGRKGTANSGEWGRRPKKMEGGSRAKRGGEGSLAPHPPTHTTPTTPPRKEHTRSVRVRAHTHTQGLDRAQKQGGGGGVKREKKKKVGKKAAHTGGGGVPRSTMEKKRDGELRGATVACFASGDRKRVQRNRQVDDKKQG